MPRVLTGMEDLYVSKNGNSPVVRVSDVQNWLYTNMPIGLQEFFSGKPANSQVVYGNVALGTYRLPPNLTLSFCKATIAATASTTFNIQKNGSNIGTMVFAASGTTATFTFANAVTFVAGDVLTVVGPASADATLANIAISFAAQQA